MKKSDIEELDIAGQIATATASLNMLVTKARSDGLRVDLEVVTGPSFYGLNLRPEEITTVQVEVFKPLRGRKS